MKTHIIALWIVVSILVAFCIVDVIHRAVYSAEPKEPNPVDGTLRLYDDQLQWWTKSGLLLFPPIKGWYCANSEVAKALGIGTLEARISCLERGGHEWEYEKVVKEGNWISDTFYVRKITYIFTCKNCSERKTKTLDELTPAERQALGDLGIITNEP